MVMSKAWTVYPCFPRALDLEMIRGDLMAAYPFTGGDSGRIRSTNGALELEKGPSVSYQAQSSEIKYIYIYNVFPLLILGIIS